MSLTPPDKDNMGDWNQRNNANQWQPGTVMYLCTVPWDAQYRDIVEFDSHQDLNAYLTKQTTAFHRIERTTHVRPLEPIRVNIPLNTVLESNYVMVSNPVQPIPGDTQMDFYYFILDARYIAPNTTQVTVQLDVWQTYGKKYEPGVSYVERGHVGIANRHTEFNHGRNFLTVPEGLDQGNEYNVILTDREQITDRGDYSIIVWSTGFLVDNPDSKLYVGTLDDPAFVTAKGSTFEGVPNGATPFIFKDSSAFTDWLRDFQDKSWVTQSIISVQAIPNAERYLNNYSIPDGRMKELIGRSQVKEVELASDWRDTYRQRIPEEYRHLHKFLTYPYTIVEVTTYTGAPIVLKPEHLDGDGVRLKEVPYLAQPSPRIVITPVEYNKHPNADGGIGVNDGGEFLDISTGIYDFPTFSVVNNGYMSFMASNRHSIQHQHSQADWSQQKALRSADTSYDQATMGIDAANQQAANSVNTNNQTLANQNQHGTGRAITQAGTSLGMGMTGGPLGMIGGVTSAVSTGANEAINQSERNAQNAITNSSLQRSSQIQEQLSSGIRDSNQSLAQFAAKGDYAQAQAAINAKTQDAKMIQPTISGQMGGEAFNLATHQWGYDVKIKTVHDGAMRSIGDFWLRYGYALNQPLRPRTLQVMEHFSYWKFQEYRIRKANMPEQYKNTIRGIFEKGVTVWGDPEDIGYIGIEDNAPVVAGYFA